MARPGAFALACLYFFALSVSAASALPNVVVIIPDDMPCFWSECPALAASFNTQKYYSTPAIDMIRDQGVTFTNAYGASSTCAPGRYSVWTGRYPSRSKYGQSQMSACGYSDGVLVDVKVANTKLDEELGLGIGKLLQEKGYKTGVFGKWHLKSDVAASASSWFSDAATKTVGGTYTDSQQHVRNTGVDTAEGLYITNLDNDCDASGLCASSLGFSHNPEWVTAETNSFINATLAVNASQPFFVWFAPTMPHAPDANEALGTLTVWDTPSGTLTHDPVSGMISRADQYATVAPETSNKALGAVSVDAMVASLWTNLEAHNVLNNTLIIYVMDNGQPGKGISFESGARVAMFARYPAHAFFAPGTTKSGPTQNVDILPSILELVGVDTASSNGNPMDGTSWLTNSEINNASSTRALFFQNNQDRFVVRNKMKLLSVVRGTDYLSGNGCGYSGTSADTRAEKTYPHASTRYQLYDLVTDPTEQVNVFDDAAYADAQQELLQLLACHATATALGATPAYQTCGDSVVAVTATADDTTGATDGDPAAEETNGSDTSLTVTTTAASGSWKPTRLPTCATALALAALTC